MAAAALLVLAVPARSAPLTSEFAAAWRQAEASYRHAQFAQAYRQFAPLVAEGTVLDEGVQRYLFTRGAAFASCMAGMPVQAHDLAQLTNNGFGPLPPNLDRDLIQSNDDSTNLFHILRGEFGQFDYQTRNDHVDGAGRLIDYNGNGRIDDYSYLDITGAYIELPTGSRRRPIQPDNDSFPPVLGWYRDSCEMGVSVVDLPQTITIPRTGSPRISVRCTWAVACTGRMRLATRGKNQIIAQVLANAVSYSVPSEQRDAVELRLTAAGRVLLARGATVRSGVLENQYPRGGPHYVRLFVPWARRRVDPCSRIDIVLGTIYLLRVKGTTCRTAQDVAERWLAKTGYTPGFDAPPRDGAVDQVGRYRCVYRQPKPGADGTTTCTSRGIVITIHVSSA